MSARARSQTPPPPASRPSANDLDTHAAAVVAAMSGAAPPNIPYNVLSEWTNTFSDDKLIGQGAYGKVYVAVCHDALHARARVAVKWCPRQLADAAAASAAAAQQSQTDAVRREINVLRSFHHPNICWASACRWSALRRRAATRCACCTSTLLAEAWTRC